MQPLNRHRFLCTTAAFLLLSLAGVTGCKQSVTVSGDHSADMAKLRQLDADWVKAAATHNADAWDAFYADDAVVLPPNEPTASNPAAIRKSIAAFLSLPDLVVSWAPTQIVISDAGDMAYDYGIYKMSAKDAKGAAITDTGKELSVWRKRNGEWKCVVDTWNTDMPLPAS